MRTSRLNEETAGGITRIAMQGIRLSGKNHTFTSGIDNFCVYTKLYSANAIMSITQPSNIYAYLGDPITLPTTVTASMGDKTMKDIPVEWTSTPAFDETKAGPVCVHRHLPGGIQQLPRHRSHLHGVYQSASRRL